MKSEELKYKKLLFDPYMDSDYLNVIFKSNVSSNDINLWKEVYLTQLLYSTINVLEVLFFTGIPMKLFTKKTWAIIFERALVLENIEAVNHIVDCYSNYIDTFRDVLRSFHDENLELKYKIYYDVADKLNISDLEVPIEDIVNLITTDCDDRTMAEIVRRNNCKVREKIDVLSYLSVSRHKSLTMEALIKIDKSYFDENICKTIDTLYCCGYRDQLEILAKYYGYDVSEYYKRKMK